MSAPAGPNAGDNALPRNKTSDVHVIDIDNDIATAEVLFGAVKETDQPVVHVKIEMPAEINGNLTSKKPSSLADTVQGARDAFDRGVTRPLDWRRRQLEGLLRMYEENRDLMIEVLHKDLRRSKMEAVVLEVDYLINDIKNTLHHLSEWAKPVRPPKGIINILDDVVIYNDPFGVALVIGAWNYPLQLLLLPMSGAIAAGNAVIVKPSELAEACTKFVVEVLPKYVDNEAIIVVEGGANETTELLKQRFDYIFYTGGTNVGKIVYAAATKNLTPVTLELGGKSPVYIDSSADLEVSAKRLLWGKFINVGQTCIAPDYVLCTREVQDKLVSAARRVLKEWYGDNPQKSPDLCRIINDRHFSRLQSIIDASKDKVVIGGNYDAQDRFIEPTILANVTGNDKAMADEIFGPILPIVPVENAQAAIKFINAREKPLTMYIFCTDNFVTDSFVTQTSSGGMCINDTMLQMSVETLPFGGVGHSGFGVYHGKATFDTFTHKKSCLAKNFAAIGEKLASARYPPYSDGKLNMLSTMVAKRHGPSFKYLPYLLAFALGAGLSYGIFAWNKMSSEEF